MGGTLAPGRGEDLILSMSCRVTGPQGDGDTNPHKYHYGNINIIKGGSSTFDDARIEFWAKSILIENGGSLIAGLSRRRSATRAASRSCCTVMRNSPPAPARATAGKASSAGPRPTGIPGRAAFRSSPSGIRRAPDRSSFPARMSMALPSPTTSTTTTRCRTTNERHDEGLLRLQGPRPVGYGGTIALYWQEGRHLRRSRADRLRQPAGVRLDRLGRRRTPRRIKRSTARSTGVPADEIVITTTDYLPEPLRRQPDDRTAINPDGSFQLEHPLDYAHNGERYTSLASLPTRLRHHATTAETRAPVALLTAASASSPAGETSSTSSPRSRGLHWRPHDRSPGRSRTSSCRAWSSSARPGGPPRPLSRPLPPGP